MIVDPVRLTARLQEESSTGGLLLCLTVVEPGDGTPGRLLDLARGALAGTGPGLAASLVLPGDDEPVEGPVRALVRIPRGQPTPIAEPVCAFLEGAGATWTAYRMGTERTFDRPEPDRRPTHPDRRPAHADRRPTHPDRPQGGPTPGRRVAFTAPLAGLRLSQYRERFRAHFAVTEAHTPGIWRYRQTEVRWLAGDATVRPRGLSEFWFTTSQAEQYGTEEQHQAVAADADTFVARGRTLSFGGVEHELRPGAPPGGDPTKRPLIRGPLP